LASICVAVSPARDRSETDVGGVTDYREGEAAVNCAVPRLMYTLAQDVTIRQQSNRSKPWNDSTISIRTRAKAHGMKIN
jgi:hypothetical protein